MLMRISLNRTLTNEQLEQLVNSMYSRSLVRYEYLPDFRFLMTGIYENPDRQSHRIDLIEYNPQDYEWKG